MNKLKLLLIFVFLAIGVFMVFNCSVRAQNVATYRYRCSTADWDGDISNENENGWKNLEVGKSICSATIGTGKDKVTVYIQYDKQEGEQRSKSPRYTIVFNAPITTAVTATPTLAPTATLVPTGVGTTAASGGATVTPTPTPKPSSTNRCPNLGDDTTLDVVPDCKLNSVDGSKILKGIRDHSGQ